MSGVVVAAVTMVVSGSASGAEPPDRRTAHPYSVVRGTAAEGGQGVSVRGAAYSLVSPEATPDQVDPLSDTVTITFDASIRSIGDAARQVLKPVGYSLLDGGPNTASLLPSLLGAPLPEVARTFRLTRVSEILRSLGGRGYVLVVDHLLRRVTFDPRPLYRSIGYAPDSDDEVGTRAALDGGDDAAGWQEVGQASRGDAWAKKSDENRKSGLATIVPVMPRSPSPAIFAATAARVRSVSYIAGGEATRRSEIATAVRAVASPQDRVRVSSCRPVNRNESVVEQHKAEEADLHAAFATLREVAAEEGVVLENIAMRRCEISPRPRTGLMIVTVEHADE